jgi:type III pantothenate kinase
MLLVVDVGNTQTHFGTFRGDELVEHWRFATVRDSTADELGAALRNLLELRGVGLADLSASIVSSTVPQLEPEWVSMAQRYLGHRMLAVGPGIKTGMAILIDNPRELGADRLVNAVAAHARLGGPCISVDFGTAVNYDVVSAGGDYLGGVIAPGVEISLDALTSRGAKLPRIDLVTPPSAIGKGTVDAIRAGIVFGFAAQVDGVIARIRDELGEGAPTIATGGLAGTIVPSTTTIDEVDDLLTLTGLRLLYEHNA